MPKASGVKLFSDFLSDFRSVFGLVSKGVLALPLAALLFDIGPPWPSARSVTILTGLLETGLLLSVFLAGRVRAGTDVRATTIAAAAALLLYLAAYSHLVFADYSGARDVRGLILTPEIRATLRPGMFTEGQALQGAHFDPFLIYTPWSVHAARICLVGLWLAFAGALAVLFGRLTLRLRAVKP